MTLCEALDWCRANKATVEFSVDQTVLHTSSSTEYSADTLEAVVELAVEGEKHSLQATERKNIPLDLQIACDEFLNAARKYREFLKVRYPDRLKGVVWTCSEDGELALYTESERYSIGIRNAVIHDIVGKG